VNAKIQREETIALLLVEQGARRPSVVRNCNYVIEEGRIIKHGAPTDVLADAAIQQRLSV
jgi:ABC-type branched-subunit amino acid transport system ATPase component